MVVLILQVSHFVTEPWMSKIQNLQGSLENKKMKNVRFLLIHFGKNICSSKCKIFGFIACIEFYLKSSDIFVG